MAWYALYKWFICFRKTPYTNYVREYKRYLYNEWFDSLSVEEQNTESGRQQRIREKRKRDGELALARLAMMYSTMNAVTHGRMDEYMENAKLVNKISIHQSKYW